MEPTLIDQWLPLDCQQHYVEQLRQQLKITRRRAECFIRLWAYLMVKQQGNPPQSPISQLTPLAGPIPCTHREAAELFYVDTERGSDRAAGLMIDQLVKAGLVWKDFDGNTTSLRIRALPELLQSSASIVPVQLQPDDFNPRTDPVPVASFLARNYNWTSLTTDAISHKIVKLLRQWSQQYPTGIRVLRRCDNLQPAGIYILFPTASKSEINFFLPPSRSLHLSTAEDKDPLEMALPGDPDCLAIFVRSWMLDAPYMQSESVCQLLKDTQKTLSQMRQDFPNLCDLYIMTIHPNNEALAQALGFQKTVSDPQSTIWWMYLALDRFLDLDIEQAIAGLNLAQG
ncbi:MAG: hypothetical protein F6K19_14850 [Cyanothece sp. SIO1E1]|nr:hypothetical protein [Cyanothece sp. SIO1E1]